MWNPFYHFTHRHQMNSKRIVVVGATGKQGQATVRALMKSGFPIRALARDPEKARRILHDVEIVQGDLANKDSLKGLFNDTYGLFVVLPYTKNSVEYGKSLLDLAGSSNLQHIVFSSVGGAERYSQVDHYQYKKEIETDLRALGKPYTILRPVGYMDDLANPKSIRPITGLMQLFLPPSKRFQLIALQDIGAFVAIAFRNPVEYIGKELEIAGDELTLSEVFEKIEKIKNVQLKPMNIPRFVKHLVPAVVKQMMTFYAEDGWRADLESLRKENPDLLTFEEWLKTTKSYGTEN
jgi:uncharacterized protein YbjT (DUF2867 family)